MTVLDDIVQRTRQRLAVAPLDRKDVRREAMMRARHRRKHAFAEALKGHGVNVIAEIKSASPSAGVIVDQPDVAAIARQYRAGGAAAISVVTEPEFFSGRVEWIQDAAEAGLPVVMKDFVVDFGQLIGGVAAGADAILLLAAVLDASEIRRAIAILDGYGCDALVEVHDEEELRRAVEGGARIIGVNNRDLRDFRVDLGTSEKLGALIPEGVIRVTESGIHEHADVARLRTAGFSGFLVGESLLRQNDRSAAVRRLIEGDER